MMTDVYDEMGDEFDDKLNEYMGDKEYTQLANSLMIGGKRYLIYVPGYDEIDLIKVVVKEDGEEVELIVEGRYLDVAVKDVKKFRSFYRDMVMS